MARIVDAKGAKLIGSPEQIAALLGLLTKDDSAVINLQGAHFAVTSEPIDQAAIDRTIANLIRSKARAAKRRKAATRKRTTRRKVQK